MNFPDFPMPIWCASCLSGEHLAYLNGILPIWCASCLSGEDLSHLHGCLPFCYTYDFGTVWGVDTWHHSGIPDDTAASSCSCHTDIASSLCVDTGNTQSTKNDILGLNDWTGHEDTVFKHRTGKSRSLWNHQSQFKGPKKKKIEIDLWYLQMTWQIIEINSHCFYKNDIKLDLGSIDDWKNIILHCLEI